MSDAKQIIAEIDEKIRELVQFKNDIEDREEKLETLAEVRKRVLSKPQAKKYLTGIWAIDKNMGGFSEGSYINIAGVNFSGKTSLVVDILKYISTYNRVIFFSFEMYENLLVNNKFKTPECDDNLVIVQKSYNIEDMDRIIRSEASKGVKFFAIDSMMKIKVAGAKEDYQKVSTISSLLARLTQELGIIIILINQIALTDIRNKRLEFKGSGDIAYDSDVSFFITVEDNEDRTLHCKKDRINERVWKENITKEENN